jgi:hypothetical protein
MIEDRTRELIHAGIDGELNDAGRAELEQRLSADPDAREYQQQMQALEAFLDRVEPRELPAGLHASIVESVPLRKTRSGWLSRGFSQFPGFVRYGLASAAGLLLAVGIYEYRPGIDPGGDLSGMTGTVLPGKGAVEDVHLDDISFDLDELSSEVNLLRRGDALVVDMRLEAAKPVSITLELVGQSLRFDAIAQMESDLDSIEIADRTISIDANGRQHFAVVLHRDTTVQADARVLLKWSSGSKVLKEGGFFIN